MGRNSKPDIYVLRRGNVLVLGVIGAMRYLFITLMVLTGCLISHRLNTLNTTLREKQIILKIDTLHYDVEAQKGSVVHLPGGK